MYGKKVGYIWGEGETYPKLDDLKMEFVEITPDSKWDILYETKKIATIDGTGFGPFAVELSPSGITYSCETRGEVMEILRDYNELENNE